MARKKTQSTYEKELTKMIASRTGVPMEEWLNPQVRATASNMVILDRIQEEIMNSRSLVDAVKGSTGQIKNEPSPLLPYYDKIQRTLMEQLKSLGLNYSSTPSKVKEDTKKGVDTEKDGLANLLTDAKQAMSDVPDF